MTTSPRIATPEDETIHTGVDGTPLTARGLRTRRRILDAAVGVFSERTFHDASIVKITEAAGVAQGTFYLYFESKEEVFHEVVRDLNSRARAAMSQGSAEGTSRLERERGGFRGYFEFVAENPALYRIMRQAEIVAPHVLQEHYEKISRGYRLGLQSAMDSGQMRTANTEVLAWILMGIGEIVGARWVLWEKNRTVPEDVFEEVMRFVAGGLGLTTEEEE